MTYQVKNDTVKIDSRPRIASIIAAAVHEAYETLVEGLDHVYDRSLSYAQYCLDYWTKHDTFCALRNAAVGFERTSELADQAGDALSALASVSNDCAYWYLKINEDDSQNYREEYEASAEKVNDARTKVRESIAALKAIRSDVVELDYL